MATEYKINNSGKRLPMLLRVHAEGPTEITLEVQGNPRSGVSMDDDEARELAELILSELDEAEAREPYDGCPLCQAEAAGPLAFTAYLTQLKAELRAEKHTGE